MDKKLKHLEMIQSVITRMSSNSFYVKGWCITLVAAILGLSSKDSNKKVAVVVYYPVVMFWVIDGFFLLQERLYRRLFDDVRARDESQIDFSMNTADYKREKFGWLNAMFSRTSFIFYGIILVATLVAILTLNDII